MKKLYLDIETIPVSEEFHNDLHLLHDKKKKNEDFEQFLRQTAFDGSFGIIICIGYAIDDEEANVLYNKEEKIMLEKFWEIAKDVNLFIGHNVMDFDLRFIYQRSVINGVKPTQDLSFARYRNYPIYDTMKEWVKWSLNSLSLEHLALAMGIPTPKDEIDGSQVYEFYKNGKLQEILDYCKRDVETTRAVYKKMTFS